MKLTALLLAIITAAPAGADQIKANNNISLDLGGSWVSGVAPGAGDDAIWNSSVLTAANCTNMLDNAVSWLGIVISNSSAPVMITGNTTLTTGANGIDMSSAGFSLAINCGALNLGANQNWNVASGLTLTTGSATSPGSVNSPNNGNYIITKAGLGVWTTSGTADNGSIGLVINAGTVNLNKTSNSGAHAVGGPGLTVSNGGTARITGTGGDQIYDGAPITLATGGTFDLNGNNETVAYLAGAGGTVDDTAPGTSSVLTSGSSLGSGSSTFSGTINNSGAGATLALVKSGNGTLTLNGANTYTGGTTVNAGTLALSSANNAAMPYTLNGGTLSVSPASAATSLPMTSLTLSANSPQLTFNFNSLRNLAVPIINDSGNLAVNGNIAVNVMNVAQSGSYVLLHYAGARSGSGGFVAGSLPGGATLIDDTANQTLTLTYASLLQPAIVIPSLNTNEIVVGLTTPQQFGAVGDGITDDSAAFQNAMNAVYNSGGPGGGVVFVPAGFYAFYKNISIPTGVTLHGNWTNWTTGGGGLVGTTFKIYFGAGQAASAPFITMSDSTALRDVNIWYPNQNASNIVSYPFSIGIGSASVVQNVVLVNSYQGIESYNGGDESILSTVIGSPLFMGIAFDQVFDVCHSEDIRFSPDIWPASLVSNAPPENGPHAAWMRANGEAMRLLRVDGDMCIDTYFSGYKVGIEANAATNGQPGVTFYSGAVSNCATAFLAQDMPSAFGPMFACFTLDGDIAVNRTNTADDANVQFDRCLIIGRNGTAVSSTGSDWHSWMQFQDCTISNTLNLAGPGVFNVVDSTLLGATQCVLSGSATRVAFTGCTFSPGTNIVNNGNPANLIIDPRASISNTLPRVYWTNVVNNYLSRKAATTNLYVATDAPWGAYGDGVHDDTAAIQSALASAEAGGGGIVYLPAGKYHLSNTLDVPSGVELRGAFEMRHRTWPGADGYAKGTVLQPYGGEGTSNAPPSVALESNAGLVGVTISYETQNTNCIPFPPAIQGRGANVYAIGVCCPNPYLYVDFDTYTCSNHFLDMVDGWALKTGYNVGGGSSGTIVDCHCNWTYWIDNLDSQSSLPQSIQAPVLSFTAHQLQMYTLGNCSEVMVKDFSIIENQFMHCFDENGQGPNLTLINNYCDATIQGFVLDAAAPCNIAAVNTPMTTFNFGNYSDLAEATVAVLSTTNFQGTARFTSSVLWGGTYLDFVVNGGDVGFDMAHMDSHSFIGSIVNGGVFHLINNSAYSADNGPSNFPPYNVTFGPAAGLPGKTSEIIGCYAYNGCGAVNPNTNNPLAAWNDYALSSYSEFNPQAPVVYDVYPAGSGLFQYTNVLSFIAASQYWIDTNNITVTLNGANVTNLVFNGSASSWTVSDPDVAVNRAYTVVITVTDNSNQVVSTTVSFDTFNPTNDTFEAEDFDYNGGRFFNNPQTNAYAGLSSISGIDFSNTAPGQGNNSYRPQGLETEDASDVVRAAYNGTGFQDYDVGFNERGNWGNYTRQYPVGAYHIYMRAANDNASTVDSASLSVVTNGQGTTNQTTTILGTFSVPFTGNWQNYTWVPLLSSNGNPVLLTMTGSPQTLRVTTDNGNYNANFYELAPATVPVNPVTLAAAINNGGITILFPTQTGFEYQAQYTDSVTATNWTSFGSPISGNDATQTISAAVAGNARFYRVQIEQIQ
jgi:autotransporter-associated beta strand protein